METSALKKGVVDVNALFIANTDADSEAFQCQVVEEDALTLNVQEVGHYTLMWTPTVHNTTARGYTLEDGLLGDEEKMSPSTAPVAYAVPAKYWKTML